MRKFLNGLAVMQSIVLAFFIRKSSINFNKNKFNYFVIIIDYTYISIFFTIIRSKMGFSYDTGLDLFTTLVAGFLPFGLFRNSFAGMHGALRENMGSIYLSKTRPLDFFIAISLYEGVMTLMSYTVVLTFYYLTFQEPPQPYDYLKMLVYGLYMWLIGFSAGVIVEFVMISSPFIGGFMRF